MTQLNPFEIKAELLSVISKLEDAKDFNEFEVHFRMLDAQEDSKIISKLLFKEFTNINETSAGIIKFLLKRYVEKDELIQQLWTYIKSNIASNQVKIAALDLLREIDSSWSYDDFDGHLEGLDIVDEDTKKLLTSAIINPEVQIDFLDFLSSLGQNDKITLLQSLGDDYEKDELANILIPVFLSQPDSEVGKTALSLLGESRSQLAFHALNTSKDFVNEEMEPLLKKSLATLKLAGIREDNSIKFYKELLKDSKPYRCCVTYPDGHGNQALIFSRINSLSGKVQFVAIVIDDYRGIRDCFGFNEISKFECNAIIDRFYRGESALEVAPEEFKGILSYAQKVSQKSNNWFLPYEYACWRNLLADIEEATVVGFDNYNCSTIQPFNLSTVFHCNFMDRWFLNSGYSTEFDEFISGLNVQLLRGDKVDFDDLIVKNLDTVFYADEKKIWTERILTVAYLKELEGDKELAQMLRSLYCDEAAKTEFLKNILRKSIYEYYIGLQHDESQSIFDARRLGEIIVDIEQKWVGNV